MSLLLEKEMKGQTRFKCQPDKMHNSLMKANQVVSDGRIVSYSGDPPGQYSVYIRPGDPRRELYRLSTFEKFPEYSPINPCQLAAGGFFYTGYKDRVKCFSCSQTVENWSPGDDPLSSRWHSMDCQFIRGADNSNVPFGTTFENQRTQNTSTMLTTAAHSSATSGVPRASSPGALTSGMSRNQNDVLVTTAPTSTNTASASSNVETSQNTNAANASSVSEQLAQIFPCSNPVNPHMRSEATRLQTFRDRSDEWPAHRIAATPERMSQAGLYYLGERDRVKCWYCNGGLQNWARFDNPWFEHAKWFPTCEYLLQKKGPEFVVNVVNRFPNLDRPAAVNPAGPLVANVPQAASRLRFSPSSNEFPQIFDPREQRRKLEKRVDEEMKASSFVAEAKLMGFSDEEVRGAFLKQIEDHNATFASFANLVESVLALQKVKSSPSTSTAESQNRDRPSTSNETCGSSGTPQNKSRRQEFEELKQMSLCKKCFQSKASVVFLPCGHLAVCSNCSRESPKCPICKANVREKVQSYIV